MVIIGGLGSIMGSFFGAAFIVLLPIVPEPACRSWLGIPISTAIASHLELMIFGALIVFFLIVEPHGLAVGAQIHMQRKERAGLDDRVGLAVVARRRLPRTTAGTCPPTPLQQASRPASWAALRPGRRPAVSRAR